MEKFVHDENIRLYRRLLAEATDTERRRVLLKLLADEEAKDQRPPERKQVEPSGDNTASRPPACCEAPPGIARPSPSNENGGCPVYGIPSNTPQSSTTGPIRSQTVEHPTTPAQMVPIMPGNPGAMMRETKTTTSAQK